MPKRAHTDDADLANLRSMLLGKLATLMDRSADDVTAAVKATPTASLLDLGLTSAMGVSLKGWVFKDLSAELTTYELLKQPFDNVVLSIDGAQRQTVGICIPDLPPAGNDAQQRAAALAEPVSLAQ
eukprot:CAMPEP_0174719880 /NCGR_PEP_ID=MMETSP1094-20130205/32203_1 /TAXON_ID=156173 /ORGANISM="Chrysochromulina brevifilum, Strain UTEX LB 985" /LENGTH=125 /DNA_ID=CAMNT_0015920271 /DNA_START=39 /DNA_END=416 /DNA_ORIENTATION=-